jgi:topoisomerase IA-like protein
MKIKFIHDSMYFDKVSAKDVTHKKGSVADIDDADAASFISQGRAEKATAATATSKAAPAPETKAAARVAPIKKATTKATAKKAAPKRSSKK